MSRRIDVAVGTRYGLLVAISEAAGRKYKNGLSRHFLCLCDCGNTCTVNLVSLRRGDTKSCGCMVKKHGMYYGEDGKKTRIYQTWEDMKSRCRNPNRKGYSNYGGRGIRVCEEWLADFNTYFAWCKENGYTDSLTLDRIDVNGNYEPSNCRWATGKEQCNNKRNNVNIEHDGVTKTVSEWARIHNLTSSVLGMRIKRGWDTSRAFSEPAKVLKPQCRLK